MKYIGHSITLLFLCFAVTITGTFKDLRMAKDELSNIIESKNTNDGKGNYEFQVRTSDGITRWEAGRVIYSGDTPYIHVEGGYSYIRRTDSVKRIVTYVHDQDGYRPLYSESPAVTLAPQFAPFRLLQGAAK